MKKVHIAQFSGGKDSAALVLRLIEEGKPLDEIINYDTGMEFKATYKVCEQIKTIAEAAGIKYTTLHNDTPFLYTMLVKPVTYREKKEILLPLGEYMDMSTNEPEEETYPFHYGYSWCGGGCRWETTNKVRITDTYLKENYGDCEIVEYVGIAYDEPDRIKDKEYPLVEWKMTEADCLKYCHDHGIYWMENGIELYDILIRVSCWCCRNKNLDELYNIYVYLPEYWQMLRGLQSRIPEPFKGPGKSIFELEEVFKKKREIEESNQNYQQLSMF